MFCCSRTGTRRDLNSENLRRSGLNLSASAMHATMFLALTFLLAGIVQTIWLQSRLARAFAVPIDGGLHLRGRRLFGDNKTYRGFVVMVPASGLSFLVVSMLWRAFAEIPWSLNISECFLVGCLGGFGFMAGELPNSFLKRQLDIPAGAAASNRLLKPSFFVLDQVDSTLGGLLAVGMVIDIPSIVWLWLVLLGGTLHLAVNALLFQLNLRDRFA